MNTVSSRQRTMTRNRHEQDSPSREPSIQARNQRHGGTRGEALSLKNEPGRYGDEEGGYAYRCGEPL
jgi:hypothetical protein